MSTLTLGLMEHIRSVEAAANGCTPVVVGGWLGFVIGVAGVRSSVTSLS